MSFAREASPFASQLPPIERLRRAYRRAFIVGTYWGDFQASFLAPTRADGRPDRVLDAGCGRGEVPALFRRYDVPLDYYGVDLAVGDPTWQFRVTAIADLHRLPFRDGSFDKVVCSQVLEHVDDPIRVFGELARVVRPGGRVFLSLPFIWHLHQEPFDRFRFSVHALRQMTEKYGMIEDEIRPMGGYFSTLRYLLNHGWTVWSQFPKPIAAVIRAIDRPRAIFDRWAIAPVAYALDQLDRSPKITLGYFIQLTKPGNMTELPPDPYCCPECRQSFVRLADSWTCSGCRASYAVSSGVPVLSPPSAYAPVGDVSRVDH
jgi:SAM-dependent methyltransferase/uncharacterized protein YbaR (Trm112 family)